MRFVANLSKIAEPLTRLTNEDVPIVWDPEQYTAFDELKTRLQTTSILGYFDEDADTELHVYVGLGAVPLQ